MIRQINEVLETTPNDLLKYLDQLEIKFNGQGEQSGVWIIH